MDILPSLRNYIRENFLQKKDLEDIGDDDQLLDSGIVDSMGIIKLVSFLESQFGIEVEDDQIVPENFETMTSIAAYVTTRLEK